MSINAFGTDAFLRTQIENKLKAIAADDRMIIEDGVHNLSISELQQACMARGLSFNGVSPNRMKNELTQWLDLHLEHKVPSSLLLLSNAFQTTGSPFQTGTSYLDEKAEALQATLSSLPHQVINEASLKISEEEGVATNKQKLDVLREQEELIEDELEQEQLASEKQKEAKENKDVKTSEKEEKTLSEQKENSSIVVETKVETVHSTEKVDLKLPSEEPVESDLESELSEEEKQKLVDALKTMTSDSAINDVKETFHELKEDRQDFIQVRIV
jgi:LETM1 and EF-hand domain-containing protein 1